MTNYSGGREEVVPLRIGGPMWPLNMEFFQAKVTIFTPTSGLPNFEKHIQEPLANLLAVPKAIILT